MKEFLCIVEFFAVAYFFTRLPDIKKAAKKFLREQYDKFTREENAI